MAGNAENSHVLYQIAPTKAKLRTRHIVKRHGIIFMWHDPARGTPRGEG
ncbi:hypothetical protein [Sphingobium sp.]|nr:hypothetical protein [Sphingobium sp.]HUD93982.1 hypothetical protein [Sphingobium sp.]